MALGVGPDPSATFALDRPTFVYALRLRFTTTPTPAGPATVQMYWRTGSQPFSESERTARFAVAPGKETSATVWINGEVGELRIDPADGACRFELHELTLLRESPDFAAKRKRR
jgi:hypothetical protein